MTSHLENDEPEERTGRHLGPRGPKIEVKNGDFGKIAVNILIKSAGYNPGSPNGNTPCQ
jgi:hypothetical protein